VKKVGQLRFGLKKNERRDRDERQVEGRAAKWEVLGSLLYTASEKRN